MKQKSIVWRVLAILLLAFLWGGNIGTYAEKRLWGTTNYGDYKKVTLYYSEKESLGYYDWWISDDLSDWKGWATFIVSVTFDKSFADYCPTSLKNFFAGLNILEEIKGLEYLNTSDVETMECMFARCEYLRNVDLSHFNTSKVTSMSRMFSGCHSLSSLDLSTFNTSNVTSMSRMFSECHSLSSLDLSHFNTSKVTSMYYMFEGCSSLSSLDVSNLNSSNVESMSGMFNGCSSLKSLDLSNLNTSNVDDMWHMFEGCSSLTSLNLSNFNTSKVKLMNDMFNECSSLASLDISKFNTSNTWNMANMFKNCSSLTKIYVSTDFNTDNVTKSDDMFAGCTNLQGDIPFNEDIVDKTYAKTFGGYFFCRIRPWAKFADGTLTFQYGKKENLEADEYDLNFEDESTPDWLYKSINKVVFDKSFADARPEYCCNWFNQCRNLESIEGLEYLNASNVKSMEQMFNECDALTTLDLSMLDVQNVTNFRLMFNNCRNLTELNLTSFNTWSATNMYGMFANCTKLTTIWANYRFRTDGVTTSTNMFKGCTSLKGDKAFDPNFTDKTYAVIVDGYFSSKDYIRPWAKLADGTLTFYYSSKQHFSKGEYTLNVRKNDPNWLKDASSIKKVVFDDSFGYFENYRPKSCYRWFYGASQLTSIEGWDNLLTSEITDMEEMFSGCSSLTSLDLSKMHMAQKVTDMTGMFQGCSSLTSVDLTNLRRSFPKVRYMNRMFEGCSALTSLNFNRYSTSSVRTMEDMFKGCSSLTSLDLTSFNTQNVSKMSGMFSGCSSLAELSLQNFDTSQVWDMENMFSGCTSLKLLDLSNFNTQNANYMQGMFSGCSALEQLDLSSFNTSAVRQMDKMFSGCTALKQLDLSSFNTSEVRQMDEMFSGCNKLRNIFVSDKFTTKGLNSSDKMFDGCLSLPGFDASATDGSKACYRSQDGYFYSLDDNILRPWAELADGTLTFRYSRMTDLRKDNNEFALNSADANPGWNKLAANIEKVIIEPSFSEVRPTTGYKWFAGCKNLTNIEGIENLNTSEMTSMREMFNDCNSLTSIDLSNFDTQNVTDMFSIFYKCYALKSLDLSSFNTQNVTNMTYMFLFCTNLESLDLSNFNTENVTSMTGMFENCYALTSLDLTSFDTKNVKLMDYTFYNLRKLKYIHISDKFVAKKLQTTYGMFSSSDNVVLVCQPSEYEALKVNMFADRIRPCVSINAKSPFGTLCVPFGSQLTKDSYTGFDKLYRVKSANADEGTITFEEATEIEPGASYVYRRNLAEGDESIITFTVDNKKTSVTAPQNEGNLMKGTFERIIAPEGSYLLQSDGNFHPVPAGNTTIGVGANRAYLDLSSIEASGAKTYRMVFEEKETSGMKGISDNADNQPKVYIDLMGRRVDVPQKGNVYIVSGKKIVF